MAKRTIASQADEPTPIEEQPTDEQWAEWAKQREAEHEARLAPCRAMHRQQNEQDELIAELMFKETMRELEG